MRAAILLGFVIAPAVVHANGRFPAVMSLAVEPSTRDRIFVGTTFGAIVSRDGGATWRWICEDAMGYGGVWDPIVVIEEGTGVIAATTPNGLRVSEDDGCTWEERGTAWISDVEIRDDGAWLVATATGGTPNGVFLSTDRGRTLEPTDLASDSDFFRTILLDPGGTERAYVVSYGYNPPTGTVYQSDDGGERWTPSVLAADDTSDVFLLGLDPSAPEILYDLSPIAVPDESDEWIVRRANAANGARETILSSTAHAFAISADGRTLLVGENRGTVLRSTDGGESFGPTATPIATQCFVRSGDRVYACADNWEDGFAVGWTEDRGDSWEPLMRFSDVEDVLECPAGTPTAELCGPLFPALCKQLGLSGPGCPGGDADADGDGDADDPDTNVMVTGGGGCGCTTSPLFAVAVLALAAERGRRRRRGR